MQACFGAVILTNTQGEYFDVANNSVARYVYAQLKITSGSATLEIFQPPLTAEVKAAVIEGGLADIVVKPVSVSKSVAQILKDKKLSLDFQVVATPQLKSEYELSLSLLGQFINTNDYSEPNPVQYFLLQMFPVMAGVTQNVFCDVYYGGKTTTKWLFPSRNNFISQGLFLSSNWTTPRIVPAATKKSTLNFTFQIPVTSFVGLPDSTYQIRIAVIMAPSIPIPGLAAVQFGTIQKLLDSAIYDSTTSNTAYQIKAIANVTYLTKLLAGITAALP